MRLPSVITTCILSVLCIGGCGSPARQQPVAPVFPPSHREVEMRAAETALKRLDLPGGDGRGITVGYDDPDAGHGILGVAVPRFLMEKNYRIFTAGDGRPRFNFRLTGLTVVLENGSSGNDDGATIRRTAEAGVAASVFPGDGSRQVYESTGTYSDAFASHLLDSLAEDDPHVENHISDPIESRLKPVALGIAMTVMSWLLYSYRG